MKKYALLIFASLVGLSLLVGCASNSDTTNITPDDDAKNADKAITIVHTNDIHGHFSGIDSSTGEASETDIGTDTVAAIRDKYAQDSTVFLLDAGDATQGIYFVTQSNGEAAIDIMNQAGYDAMTLGNHEFDYGWFQLINLIEMAEFPILSQLNDEEAQKTENLKEYTVIERDGIKLGVFGLTTPETQFKSNGGFNRDFGTEESLITFSESMVEVLRDQEQVDYVICLSHLGVEDMGYGTSYDIRDNVDGIDLIIDGHSHTVLADIDNVEGKTQITSTGAYSINVGIAHLENVDGKVLVEVENMDKEASSEFSPEAAISKIIQDWADIVAEDANRVVAQIPFDIVISGENERTQETVMGNILTDAIREASGADVALVNGGSIRDQTLLAGDVRQGQLISILPFGNVIQMAEVKGSVILEALEQGVSMYPEANEGFAHVSGITYTFDPSKEVGSRIQSAYIGGQALDPDATYTLSTNDFVAAGGDLFTMFVEPFSAQLPLAKPELTPIELALTQYLNDNQDKLSSQVEGRIQVVE